MLVRNKQLWLWLSAQPFRVNDQLGEGGCGTHNPDSLECTAIITNNLCTWLSIFIALCWPHARSPFRRRLLPRQYLQLTTSLMPRSRKRPCCHMEAILDEPAVLAGSCHGVRHAYSAKHDFYRDRRMKNNAIIRFRRFDLDFRSACLTRQSHFCSTKRVPNPRQHPPPAEVLITTRSLWAALSAAASPHYVRSSPPRFAQGNLAPTAPSPREPAPKSRSADPRRGRTTREASATHRVPLSLHPRTASQRSTSHGPT